MPHPSPYQPTIDTKSVLSGAGQRRETRRKWNTQRRDRLRRLLGGRCAYCGLCDGLDFDCKKPTKDGHGKLSTVQRMTYYLRQYASGNLQLLCRDCNVKKGVKPHPRYVNALPLVGESGRDRSSESSSAQT